MDKTGFLMNSKKQNAINKNKILSRNAEYQQQKKKILKDFQNIVAIFKINSIDFFVLFLYVVQFW